MNPIEESNTNTQAEKSSIWRTVAKYIGIFIGSFIIGVFLKNTLSDTEPNTNDKNNKDTDTRNEPNLNTSLLPIYNPAPNNNFVTYFNPKPNLIIKPKPVPNLQLYYSNTNLNPKPFGFPNFNVNPNA